MAWVSDRGGSFASRRFTPGRFTPVLLNLNFTIEIKYECGSNNRDRVANLDAGDARPLAVTFLRTLGDR